MISALQMTTSDLAYDTAPSPSVATSMLLEIINMKLRMVTEKEFEDEWRTNDIHNKK